MSCPRARCSNSRPREARALWGWSRSSARSRWGGAPTSWCWTSAARISPPRLRTRCRTSCTRSRRATCATCSWTAARWCSTASCSRCPSRSSSAARAPQVRAGRSHGRSQSGENGGPRAELNLRRAFLVEKAYPENEVVLTSHGREQQAIYERRVGKRWQLEGAVRTVLDSLDRPFGGATVAAKYNAWYDAERRALASVGLEATPPLGRADRWEIEPFFAFGWAPGDVVAIQGQVVASLEEGEGLSAWSYRVGAGRQIGRVVPMLELEWAVPVGGERTLSF